ncbi:MAG: serine/threonine-protein kinase, partial [Gemmatimonadota bacterium]
FVHRDIKPDNIMLARGHALVADFGIARVVSSAPDVSLTATGMSLGTPLYMSPEQSLGDPKLDYQTDIYSLGCVVFEMLTGRPPFVSDNVSALLARHIAEPAPELPLDFPVEVGDAVSRALAKQPADRFPSALAFADALALGVAPGPPTTGARRRNARALLPWWKRPIGALASGAFKSAAFAGRRFWGLERWQQLGLVMLVLLTVFLTTGLGAVRSAIRLMKAEVGPPTAIDSTPIFAKWFGSWEKPVTMVTLGDTAVGVQQGSVLLIYNGTRWTRLLLPYERATLTELDGTVGALSARAARPIQRLTASGWVVGDSLPIAVNVVWGKSGAMVVANERGEFAERTPAGWQQLPSGRHTDMRKLFGPTREGITGIGVFAGASVPDSLVRRQGSFWPSYDPRPSQTDRWVYQDGTALDDGSSMVVGYEQTDDGVDRLLVMTDQAGPRKWTRIPADSIKVPQHHFDHVLPLMSRRALIWAEHEPGLVLYRAGQFESVDLLRARGVRGVVQLGHAPVVLTDAGTLMIQRGSEFEVYGEVPLRPRAGTGNIDYGELLALTRLLGGSPFLTVSRAVRAGNRAWMLTEDGSVYSAECRAGRCEARLELNGRTRVVTDLAASGDTVIVVGRNGLVERWDGGAWAPPSWARGIPGDLRLVSIARNGATIIAGSDTAYLHAPGSATFHALSYEARGLPAAIAASADSGAAILWNEYVMNVGWDGAYRKGTRRVGAPITSARYTCDGRLITVSATPGDPLIGGEAHAGFATRYPNNSLGPLPIPLDLSDVTVDAGGTISLVGRAGVWLTTGALRYAVSTCADSAGARRRESGSEVLAPDW